MHFFWGVDFEDTLEITQVLKRIGSLLHILP
jgi:hypothetical protein